MDRSRAWWVGANFLSRSGGRRMWTEYDASIVRQELRVLAEHGCSMTRSFCYWPDFVPEVQKLDERMVARLKDFLDAHVEVSLGTIPTLIVGHMSGENWDPSWRRQRNLYTQEPPTLSIRPSLVIRTEAKGV